MSYKPPNKFNKKAVFRGESKNGFSLFEMLIYISVLAIIFFAVISFLVWMVYSGRKAKAMAETTDNARRVVELISHEIKSAKSVYAPTSIFNSDLGQLSLETLNYLPAGEDATYIDFYVCGGQVCFKKESQNPIAITSDALEVEKLIFTRTISGSAESVQMELGLRYKNPLQKPEYQATVNLKSTASLRFYQ